VKTTDITKEQLDNLFQSARDKDEFEFVLTLINYKGIGHKEATSNLFEWFDAIECYSTLFKSSDSKKHKVRIGLLLYSTFFESSDLYNVIGNLARINLGFRASSYLYYKHSNAERWYGTGEKISRIEEILIDSGFEPIQHFFEKSHHKQLRNTFFHSAYSIIDDTYQLLDSDPIIVNECRSFYVDIETFLFPLIEDVISFFKFFKENFNNHFLSYNSNKKIKGKMPELIEIDIYGSAKGLLGINGNGSSIMLINDVWEGLNIQFSKPSEEDKHVMDELNRFAKKDSIRSNDGSLQYLYEVILEREKQSEMLFLANIYGRLGDIIFSMAKNEQNDFKQVDLHKRALKYYDKMAELNPATAIYESRAILKFLVPSDNLEIKKESLNDLIICLNRKPNKSLYNNICFIITRMNGLEIDISEEIKAFQILLTDVTQKY
jgi:hypothetical protein